MLKDGNATSEHHLNTGRGEKMRFVRDSSDPRMLLDYNDRIQPAETIVGCIRIRRIGDPLRPIDQELVFMPARSQREPYGPPAVAFPVVHRIGGHRPVVELKKEPSSKIHKTTESF